MLTSLLLSLASSFPPQDAPVVDPAVDPVDSERSAILGPVLGDLRLRSARIWLRSGDGAAVEWSLSTGGEVVERGTLEVSDERDRTAVLSLEGLRPHTDYRATLKIGSGEERTVAFKTLQRHDAAESVRIAFGSCASHDRFESQPIWTAIARTDPRALVLLGDTPYIDSTDLARQRKRYREFWSIPELRPLAESVPVYSTWDDHDFATNDQVGAQPGRENSRRVFIEYHAQPSFGDGELGIDTSFRSGPVEVFLIDTRWYGDEERWPDDDATGEDTDGELTSLLGRRQREALIASVIASTADVKVLSCGMVWNDAVRPGKRDHWGTWAHERDAILGALGEAGVKGIVLVGGDIHIPRVIRHIAAKERLGYVPVELVSSPLANQPIPAATAPHPGLVWNVQAPSVALILEVERGETAPRVVARFIGPDGDALYVHSLAPADLGY